jgi:hypothetical protein
MAVKINITFPDGRVLTMGGITGLSQSGLPIKSQNQVKSESIAWGWGTSLNKCLKGIESLCNEIINNEDLNAVMSTEGINAGETAKKVITWIVEKLKALANIIKEFFEKVKTYINNEQHKELSSDKSINLALENLKYVILNYVDSTIVDSLVQDRVLMAYHNARHFSHLFSRSDFSTSYNNFMNGVEKIISTNYDTTSTIENTYNDYKKSVIDKIEEVKELTKGFVEKDNNIRKNMKFAGDSHPAIQVLKQYKTILYVQHLIQDKFIMELNEAIVRQNKILQSISHTLTSGPTDGNRDMKRL